MERSAPDDLSTPWLSGLKVMVDVAYLGLIGTFRVTVRRDDIKSDGTLDMQRRIGHGEVVGYKLCLTSRVNTIVLLDALRLKRGEPRGFLLPPGALSTSWAYVPHADFSPLPRAVASGDTEIKVLLAAWAAPVAEKERDRV